ncbi:hypothetical protein PINS_up004111 [Pythium insidiosum]|nr:hypothetical protein PINS_up004111 [Pythium insidiosum]
MDSSLAKKVACSSSSRHSVTAHSVWTPESIAIPVTYLCSGLLLSFPQAYVEVFPRTLQASDAQLATIKVVRFLPWSIKVLFGVLPDNFPIRQQRFKPYILLGYGMSSLFHMLLALYTESLTIVSFAVLLLGAMVGIVLSDVMSDALVASRVLQKQEAYAGQVQSTVYLCRYFSEMLGYWGGAVLSNPSDWGFGVSMSQLFAFLTLLPVLTVVPCVYLLDEPATTHVSSWRHQLETLWEMLQRRATWQPISFLALFNVMLLHNAAWGNYLGVAYHFDAFQYGALSAIAASVTFASVALYRVWIMPHFSSPWHHVYLITGCIVSLFSALNVLLVFRVNVAVGVPAFWFAVGDSAVISFAKGFQQLPLATMLVAVCPPHQEGVAFALLTSIVNLSHAFAHTISNMLLRIWPVELADLERGEFDGVWRLTLLTSAVSLLPLLVLKRLLPRGPAEQNEMKHELSPRGAKIVITLYAVGFVWVVALSLLAVAEPCNPLVGGHGCPPAEAPQLLRP